MRFSSSRSSARLVGAGVVAVAALGGIVAVGGLAQGAAPRSCRSGGARQLFASGGARIVRLDGRYLACWAPTGRRFTMRPGPGFGGQTTLVSLRVIGGLYAAMIERGTTGSSAAVWNVRTGRRVHDGRRCAAVARPRRGVEEAVFLPDGSMAYTCDQLRLADRNGDRQLVGAGPAVTNLAVSTDTGGPGGPPVLYWLQTTTGKAKAKALELAP